MWKNRSVKIWYWMLDILFWAQCTVFVFFSKCLAISGSKSFKCREEEGRYAYMRQKWRNGAIVHQGLTKRSIPLSPGKVRNTLVVLGNRKMPHQLKGVWMQWCSWPKFYRSLNICHKFYFLNPVPIEPQTLLLLLLTKSSISYKHEAYQPSFFGGMTCMSSARPIFFSLSIK